MQAAVRAALPVQTGITEKFPATSINCFTGSLVHLLSLHGASVDEVELLELGDGFLLRAGRDEWVYPELTFEVQEVGLRGCRGVGASVNAVPIDGKDWLQRISEAVARCRGAVVWVNTRHLNYDPFYHRRPSYLHALLVTGVSADGETVDLFDPLVVDRLRYGCTARMRTTAFHQAITDRVRTETYDHMGMAHVIESAMPRGQCAHQAQAASRDALRSQAQRFLTSSLHRDAVAQYAEACIDSLLQSDARASVAARRLFDHINVLYVVPSLLLLGQSQERAGCGDRVSALHLELLQHWRSLALLALKYEATRSRAVLERLIARFAQVRETESDMWRHVAQSLNAGVGAEPGKARRSGA